MQIVVGAETPPSRKKRGKSGATPNWEFDAKGWASPLQFLFAYFPRTYVRGCILAPLRGWDWNRVAAVWARAWGPSG